VIKLCSIIISILTFFGVMSLLVIIACYIKIWITVQRHLKAQVIPRVLLTEPSAIAIEQTVTNTDSYRVQFQQKRKSVITMLYVVGAFIACYVPYMCVLLVCTLVLKWNPFSRALFNLVFPIVFLNSSLNPVLYFWRMTDLRHFAKITLGKLTCKKTQDQ